MDQETMTILKCYWDRLECYDQREARNDFLKSFAPRSSRHDFYSMLSLDRIVNDSIFLKFLSRRYESRIEVADAYRDNLNYGYRHIDNLTCEPPELEAARIREISGMAK